jgi:predicted negative regulator of RcsB-dependent stress response
MATASRRITRKQLRQPDKFQVFSDQALEYFAAHKALVFAAAGAVIVLALALWGWQSFKERQNVAASHEFTRALALYQADKYGEAIPAFEKVQTYRWSRYAVPAHLYLANSYLATNQLDKALNAAERSVVATKPETLYRQIALVTLGETQEQMNRCKPAIEHFSEAQKIASALESRATLGKARCAEALGDTKTALQAYKEYLKDNPGSPLAMKVAALEPKSTSPTATK